MIFLKALNASDSQKEYDFFQQMPFPDENGFVNDYANVSYETFVSEVIPRHLNSAMGIGLKAGHVPDTYFFLWLDDTVIGLYKVRHYLNEGLRNGSGHIGYGILPAYRGKGYGAKGLALAIQECKQLMPENEDEIYMSCLMSNPASLKVMLKNGAYIHHQDDKEYYTRIKVR